MTLAVIGSMIFRWGASSSARWNTGLAPRGPDPVTEHVTIVSFVGDHLFTLGKNNLLGRDRVVSLTRCKGELNRATATVHGRCHFAVETTFSAPKSLIFLAIRRVAGVLMNFDVGRIQMSQFSIRILGKKIEDGRPDPLLGPSRPAGI